jgi:hypothetical protein
VEIALENLVQYLETGKLPEWKEYLVKPWVITHENISTGDFYSVVQDETPHNPSENMRAQ